MSTSSRTLPPAFADELRALFGERFSQGESVCLQHGRDESSLPPMPPDGVVFAESHEDVVAVLRLCNSYRVPVIPYATGSSLEGHLLAVRGGISLDVSGLNKAVEMSWEVVEKFDICHQTATRIKSFKKIMAENRVFGDAVFE